MTFLLRRSDDNKFVARKGNPYSYTTSLQNAQQYPTREAAEADKCGNEYVTTVNEAIWGNP